MKLEGTDRAVAARKVCDALDWAYRQGYCFGEQAGQAFADMEGLELAKADLGMYGDKLEFRGTIA